MHRRSKTFDAKSDESFAQSGPNAAAVSPSPGPSMAVPSSDESGVETDSSGRSFPDGRVRGKPHQKVPKRRKRHTRPAVEDIIDGFAICSFETIKDLRLFVENKSVIQQCSDSSSSESDYEPVRPSSAKSSDTVSLSATPKRDWKVTRTKHRQMPKCVGSRKDCDELSDRSLSPASFSSLSKTVNKIKAKPDILKSDNQSCGSGVSSSSVSSKNRKLIEESDDKDSSESAAFSCTSDLALREDDDKCNIVTDRSLSVFDGLDNAQLKLDRASVVALTDAESESSVVLVKEELKEADWITSGTKGWTKCPGSADENCSNTIDAKFKKSADKGQAPGVTSGDLNGKWTVIKEKASLMKSENVLLPAVHHLTPCLEPRSCSLDRKRTVHNAEHRHDLDLAISTRMKVTGAGSPAKPDRHRRLDLDGSSHIRSHSNELRSGSNKVKLRDWPAGISRNSSTAASATLASTEIKHECSSPVSVRGSSSRQSSSRSSTSHKKSSNSHSLGNDFSSVHQIDRNLRSPLTSHPAYHQSSRPFQPTAFNIGSLPLSGLFASPLPQFPVPGLHPSGSLLASSMGLHPSLLAAAPLMAGLSSVTANPVAANPDLYQVQQELNARFLQDHRMLPLSLPPVPLTLRTEMHQHLHHHQHLMPAPWQVPSLPGTFSMSSHPLSMLQTIGPSGIELLSHSQTLSDLAERERLSKVRASLNLSDGYLPPSYASLIPGIVPTHPMGLTSGMHGAFTINEAKPSSMSASHLLRSLRHDQQVVQSSIPSSSAAAAASKKKGRWCAAHIEIAFRIYYHKQRSLQLDSAAQRRHVASSGSNGPGNSTISGIHHFGLPSSEAAAATTGISGYHQHPLQFGINSFLRPTPQSFVTAEASVLASSSSSPFLPRPRQIGFQPGGAPKIDDNRDIRSLSLTARTGGGIDGASILLAGGGIDSASILLAEQDRKRKLSDREWEADDWFEKKRKAERGSMEHRFASVKSERSSPRVPLNDKVNLHRNMTHDMSRSQRLPESRSPFLSSERSSRPALDIKKRDHLAVPLSIDTCGTDGYLGTGPGHHAQSNAPPPNLLGAGLVPTDHSVALQLDRDHLHSLETLNRDRAGQSFYGQSLIADADRFRSLLPTHPAYGLSLNGLSKLEHESFKPYADLNSRLDAKPMSDVYKPNPDGLFIVSSSATRSFPTDAGGSVSSIPPPLVRLPLDDGLSSFKRHAPYSSLGNGLSEFSSSLCGLPGGKGGGVRLPFR